MKFSIFENWHLKLLAVMIAFLLWFYIVSQKSVQFTVIAPVKYQNIPESLSIVHSQDEVKFVKLILHGPKNVSPGQNIINTDVTINLVNAAAGSNTIKIFSNSIIIPDDFKLVSINPDEVNVQLDRKMTKRVKILPEITGELPPKFEFEKISVDPEFVNLIGPEKILRKINNIKTEPVSIDELLKNPRIELKLQKPDNSLRIIESVENVIVEIKIAEQMIEKQIDNIKINFNIDTQLQYPPNQIRLSDDFLAATVKGPVSIIENLNNQNINVVVQIKKNKNVLVPEFSLPANVELITFSPASVTYKILQP